MSLSSSPLVDSFPSSRFASPNPSPTRTDTDLPIEVDQSFNSSLSISDSPYFSPTPASTSASACFGKNQHSHQPLSPLGDTLSPPPANLFGVRPKRPDPVPLQRTGSDESECGRTMLGGGMKGLGGAAGGARGFGRELSGNAVQARGMGAGPSRSMAGKGMMLPPALPDKGKRGGLPMQWSSSNEDNNGRLFQPQLARRDTDPYGVSPKSSCSGGESNMDIDSPAHPARKSTTSRSPSFSGASSFSGSPGFGSFFCESPAAPPLPQGKRRPLITESPASPSGSPSAKRTSLGAARNLDKTISSGPMLFGGTASRPPSLAGRRPTSFAKRPLLAPVATGSDSRTPSFASADAVLYPSQPAGTSQLAPFARAMAAPMRRAYSVCDQPNVPDISEDETEYEASPSNPSGLGRPGGMHRQKKIGGSRLAPGVDGSPGCKPVRSSIAVPTITADGMVGTGNSPMRKGRKGSLFGGLPGFGDNEMDGKILPCHKVKEDGLVRITASTCRAPSVGLIKQLDSLISGEYTSKIKRYHIIDCRFDYEYAGGHIAGAINVKSMDALDELLLQEESGVYQGGMNMPMPSRSGELDDGEQVVLVFHCEFSAKRAPTFAKHLRSRDRTVNSALYPKIFYPEVYILEGGYCGFYQTQPKHCDPQGYTPMDDPKHFERRNSDLHDFRKFARTRSFTYGETQPPIASRGAPPCPPLAFAAASAAQGRRQGPTIDEGDEHDSSPSGPSASGNESGMEASPCPRVCSMGTAPIFGSAKTRTLGRLGMARNASYAGATFGR